MVTDILNILQIAYSLLIELGVGILILWLDRQQRKREDSTNKRRIKTETEQRDRFNNFLRETSKHQVFLLESILESLEPDKGKQFQTSIKNKYTDELQQDMEDLEQLLERQERNSEEDLSAEINQKMDELEVLKTVSKTFFPKGIDESMENISKSTKAIVNEFTNNALVKGRHAIRSNIKALVDNIIHEKESMMAELNGLKVTISEDNTEKSDKNEKKGVTDLLKNVLSEIDGEEISKLIKQAKDKKKENK